MIRPSFANEVTDGRTATTDGRTDRRTDGQTDGRTDRRGGVRDSELGREVLFGWNPLWYSAGDSQAYKSRESVLRLVSMKETHWKTMRISGISTDKHERTTLENHENIGNQYQSRESKLRNRNHRESVLSIISRKEQGIVLSNKQGISTEY
ncbi:hypothetical protein DPMN_077672 [Dreissena polymorpha]|uniref:Uncharacterized protein n=1 Tax=Dreissena polymorpha TaxID=45954 RepID=A0A9D4BPV0_DREPO|nr:hypothetical protein DPMN_077672 [Dreissena polymorpha]